MDIRRAVLTLLAGIITISCSEKSPPDRAENSKMSDASREQERESGVENGGDDLRPGDEEVEEDCAAFVRSTRVVPARA
ncbi:MAG: hypothetical protein M3Y86_03935, partial [Verrucomicrobiota bacterium]|nr:hypothetical protein [Verrucomicrobiota bacterium]